MANTTTSLEKHTTALDANTAAMKAHARALKAHTAALTAASATPAPGSVVWRSAHCVGGSRAVKMIDAQGNLYDGSEPC